MALRLYDEGLYDEGLYNAANEPTVVSFELQWQVAPSPQRVAWALDGRFGAVALSLLFERRTKTNQYLADVTRAFPAASLDLNNDRATLRTANLTIHPRAVDDRGEPIVIDPLADIIGIDARLIVDGSYPHRIPMGLYQLTAPTKRFMPGGGETWAVASSDLTAHLLSSTTTEDYTVEAGENYISGPHGVRAILDSLGLRHSIPDPGKTVVAALPWRVGTPKLTIVNDLLHGVGFYSLWFNENGIAVTRVSDELAARTPDAIITSGDMVTADGVDEESDTTRFANVVTAFTDSPDRPQLAVTLTNNDPDSPISVANLGRPIHKDIRVDRAADIDTLTAIARRELEASAALYKRASLTSQPDPRRGAHEVIEVSVTGVYEAAAWWVRNWTWNYPDGDMQYALGRVERVVAA